MHMEKILPTPPNPRVARLLRVVGHFERDQIEQAVDSLIALLDADDGDPDLEDSEAGHTNVDATGRYLHARHLADEPVGCPEGQDVAWTEWSSRDVRRRRAAQHESVGNPCVGEDDEEDDDDSACDDGPVDGDTDAEPEEYDPGVFTSAAAMDEQTRRIRATRCIGYRDRWGDRRWSLIDTRPARPAFGAALR